MSTVSDSDAAGAIKRLIWASRRYWAAKDNPLWAALETASAEAQTAVLNNSALASCRAQIMELAAWAEYRRTGKLGPGMSKGACEIRVGQLHSQLHGCAEAILRPGPQ